MRIGVLALQGAVDPHRNAFAKLGIETGLVKTAGDLQSIQGIVLPGGESTAMLHLLHASALLQPLRSFVLERPSWGVCAGAILLAKSVTSPTQESLGALPIQIERNAYGRQQDSFIDDLEATSHWTGGKIKGVFIRAPRIREVESSVQTLFLWHGEPVMVRHQNTLASTFHPELTEQTAIHEYFAKICS